MKADLLQLTRVILGDRVCVECPKKFNLATTSTTIFKHSVNHPRLRLILEQNLEPRTFKNAIAAQKNVEKAQEVVDMSSSEEETDPEMAKILSEKYKKIKTDSLGLTEVLSPTCRICTVCKQKFKITTGVSTLYKHAAKHPSLLIILKERLDESVFLNATRKLGNSGTCVKEESESSRNTGYYDDTAEFNEYTNQTPKHFDDIIKTLAQGFVTESAPTNAGYSGCKGTANLARVVSPSSEPPTSAVSVKKRRFNSESSSSQKDTKKTRHDHAEQKKKPTEQHILKKDKAFDSTLTDFIIQTGLPFEIVDTKIFQKLISTSVERRVAQIPSSGVIRSEYMTKKMKELLNSLPTTKYSNHFSLSFETFEEAGNKILIGTAWFLDEKFCAKGQCIGLLLVNDFNAIEFKKNLAKQLRSFEFEIENATAIFDSGLNDIEEYVKALQLPVVECLRSVIYKCAAKGFQSTYNVCALVEKVQLILSFYYNSLEDQTISGFALSGIKNWQAASKMIKYLLGHKEEVNAFIEENHANLRINNNEYAGLGMLSDILKTFDQYIYMVSDEDTPLSQYIPVLKNLLNDFSKYSVTMDAGEIEKRVSSVLDCNFDEEIKASEIDVIKETKSGSEKWDFEVATVANSIIQLVESLKNAVNDSINNILKSNDIPVKALLLDPCEAYKKKYGDFEFWEMVEKRFMFPEDGNDEENVRVFDAKPSVFKRYTSAIASASTSTLHRFWKQFKISFPDLYNEAMKVYVVPLCLIRFENQKNLFDWIGRRELNEETIHEISNLYLLRKALTVQ
uniref:Dimer_Tnp_hAT domain-containing protein n=1 Tax=Rhabditophanes sp. KR3021 TaxID=114890 RepID=A0AC35TKT8_9BILA